MHEMADPKKVLSEMFRVLKPGGDIVVMDVVQQKRLYKIDPVPDISYLGRSKGCQLYEIGGIERGLYRG